MIVGAIFREPEEIIFGINFWLEKVSGDRKNFKPNSLVGDGILENVVVVVDRFK